VGGIPPTGFFLRAQGIGFSAAKRADWWYTAADRGVQSFD
jgi:hypothetical protein